MAVSPLAAALEVRTGLIADIDVWVTDAYQGSDLPGTEEASALMGELPTLLADKLIELGWVREGLPNTEDDLEGLDP